jgi:NADPH:quinone reductase-like Zn-dependent oxidoreductase
VERMAHSDCSLVSAWLLHRGAKPGIPGRFALESVRLPPMGVDDVKVRPLYGAWEGNIDHALRASPVDVCELRSEESIVLGNAGVVQVEDVGAGVNELRPGDFAIVFCNGEPDQYGYPEKIFGYDAPRSVGILAQRTIMNKNQLIALPTKTQLSLPQWAGISLRYVTAWANWRVAWQCFRVQMPDIPPEDVHVWGWGGGVALAELSLAAATGCRTAMLTSKPERAAKLSLLGIDPIDRRSFREDHFDIDFLMTVREKTKGRGVSIFIDNIGVHPTTTLKAIARQGVITTSGWKHRTVFPIARAVECQNRRIHVFTHYARYEEGLAAVAFAEAHGWAPPREMEVYCWEDVPRLADDYATGRVLSYFPIFEVDPLQDPL